MPWSRRRLHQLSRRLWPVAHWFFCLRLGTGMLRSRSGRPDHSRTLSTRECGAAGRYMDSTYASQCPQSCSWLVRNTWKLRAKLFALLQNTIHGQRTYHLYAWFCSFLRHLQCSYTNGSYGLSYWTQKTVFGCCDVWLGGGFGSSAFI